MACSCSRVWGEAQKDLLLGNVMVDSNSCSAELFVLNGTLIWWQCHYTWVGSQLCPRNGK